MQIQKWPDRKWRGRQGSARHGSARRGMARQARQGVARQGLARLGRHGHGKNIQHQPSRAATEGHHMDMRAPYPANVATTLYLYDGATPEVSSQAGSDHIAVEVASLRIAAWTPDTLRRLADTLSEAANILDSRLARIDALSEGSV